MRDKAGHKTIAQLSGPKPAMLVSSVQAVVDMLCNCTEGLHFSAIHLLQDLLHPRYADPGSICSCTVGCGKTF